MLEGRAGAEKDLLAILESLRNRAGGRYACLVDRTGIRLETPEPPDGRAFALRRVIEARAPSILALASSLAAEAGMDDAFSDWTEDEFLVAVVNERAALVVACPDADGLRTGSEKLLQVFVDRVLRWDSSYRLDAQGRGLFFGRPRLDVIVVGGHDTGAA